VLRPGCCIEDLFPPPAATGRPPRSRRQILDAIFYVLRTGSPWRDVPAEFGPWQTAWRLFDAWNAGGIFDEILHRLRTRMIELDPVDKQLWCIDGTIIRAHRCAGGGGKK
jgi:transposase